MPLKQLGLVNKEDHLTVGKQRRRMQRDTSSATRSALLTPAQGMILWLIGLAFFSFMTLVIWNHLLTIQIDIWRFQYGDRSVHLDPTTQGMP